MTKHFDPTSRRWPALPSEDARNTTIRIPRGDLSLVTLALGLAADRCEGTASRMKGLAPELKKRAARLRRLATQITEAGQ
jgi:hypothetical protein